MSGHASQPRLPTAPVEEPALAEVMRRFPDDLKVAAATAQGLRSGPATQPQPQHEPWPPMRVPR